MGREAKRKWEERARERDMKKEWERCRKIEW